MNIVNAIKEFFTDKPKFKKNDILQKKGSEFWETDHIMILEVGKQKYKYLYLDKHLSVERLLELKLYSTFNIETIDDLYEKR